MESIRKNLPFLHSNIPSLCFHIRELTILVSEHKLTFDIIGMSKSQLKLDKTNLNSVQIPGYNFEFTPTESNNGVTAIYIKNSNIHKKGLNYKLRNDLQIHSA